MCNCMASTNYFSANLRNSRDNICLILLIWLSSVSSQQNESTEIDNITKWILYLPTETDIFARLE